MVVARCGAEHEGEHGDRNSRREILRRRQQRSGGALVFGWNVMRADDEH
jgi:hypothetical protein